MSKLKLENIKLKVSVDQICSFGSWSTQENNKTIAFKYFPEHQIIQFFVDNAPHRNLVWRVVEVEYENHFRNGGEVKPYQFYLVSNRTGKRFKHLYIHNGLVGPRDGFDAQYAFNCFSKAQRAIYQAYRRKGISRTRSREQALSATAR